MNILIIGNANSPFIIHFTKWVKRRRTNYKIDVFNTSNKCNIIDTYDSIIQIFPEDHFIKTSFLTKFKTLYLIRKNIKFIKNDKYDAIILHFINPWYAPLSKLLKSKTNKLIAVFWGSDLNRISKTKKERLNKLFEKTDAVILGSPVLFDRINQDIPNFKSKYNMCYFGCEPIEEVKLQKKINGYNPNSKQKLNIKPNKITIVLGYNGGRAQQHLEIIKNIKQSDDLKPFKNNIHFIFPLTYGLNKSYKNEIDKELINFNFDYNILTKFMNEEESANLRLASDIFVNLQVTDSFNGTLRESFYAGSIVINGAWLPYKTLKEMGLYYHEIQKISDLDKKLAYCLKNYKVEKESSKVNESLIYDISSWSKTIPSWLKIIEK